MRRKWILNKPMKGVKLNPGHHLARSLIGCWLFNEGSGDKVFDLSGNGINGTSYGNVSFVPGNFGSALSFSGEGGAYLDCNVIDITRYSAIAISAWFKTNNVDASRYARIVSIRHSGGDDIRIYLEQNHLYGAFDDGTVSQVTTLFTDTTSFHHVVLTYDGITITMYLDGVSVGTPVADTFDFVGADGETWMGALTGTPNVGNFNGIIDNVTIFDRDLSPSEVTQLYRDPFCMFERQAIELWAILAGPINLLSVNAVTTANIKSINAVLIGSVKSINAIA